MALIVNAKGILYTGGKNGMENMEWYFPISTEIGLIFLTFQCKQ